MKDLQKWRYSSEGGALLAADWRILMMSMELRRMRLDFTSSPTSKGQIQRKKRMLMTYWPASWWVKPSLVRWPKMERHTLRMRTGNREDSSQMWLIKERQKERIFLRVSRSVLDSRLASAASACLLLLLFAALASFLPLLSALVALWCSPLALAASVALLEEKGEEKEESGS